jgi:hypothetical protein
MAGKQWEPRRPRLTLNEVISWLDNYYPAGGVIGASYDPKTKKSRAAGDVLAEFIVAETVSIWDWEGDEMSDEDLLQRMADAMRKARGELEMVTEGFLELLSAVREARKGK